MEFLAMVATATPIALAIAAINAVFVRATVKDAIHESNEAQLAKINGTYVRSEGSRMTGAEIERALEGPRRPITKGH